jgi:uncharacterized protein YraI
MMMRWQRGRTVLALVSTMLLLAGCSLLFGGRGEEETPPAAEEERALEPTFTPTTVGAAATATPTVVAQAPPTIQVVAASTSVTSSTAATGTQALTQTEAATTTVAVTNAATAVTNTTAVITESVVLTETRALTEAANAPAPASAPRLTVNIQVANVRSGPGTEYGLAGSVTQDQAFDIVGKNPEGTWWQLCCVNGQQVWIFGELVRTEGAENVAVAQDIPAPPVAAAPQPAPQEPAPAEPAPPAATPEPPPAAAPQAVNAGACGGDDGCKFRISGGPSTRANGGGELKLQLFFKHSGVDGGQPQGDYRLGIEKDGQLITTFADARSIALESNEGPMGRFNYEAKISASELPGGTVAGTYLFWVLDGNRERDSEVFTLNLAADQGEVWIEFDQG